MQWCSRFLIFWMYTISCTVCFPCTSDNFLIHNFFLVPMASLWAVAEAYHLILLCAVAPLPMLNDLEVVSHLPIAWTKSKGEHSFSPRDCSSCHSDGKLVTVLNLHDVSHDNICNMYVPDVQRKFDHATIVFHRSLLIRWCHGSRGDIWWTYLVVF